MAGPDRMAIAAVVRKVLADEHADVNPTASRWVVQELMEAEVAEQVGAKLGERTEDRATHRNRYLPRGGTRGSRDRGADSKLRHGSYFRSS